MTTQDELEIEDETLAEAMPDSVRKVLDQMAADEIQASNRPRFFPQDLLDEAFQTGARK